MQRTRARGSLSAVLTLAAVALASASRYGFYRDMRAGGVAGAEIDGGTRRMFGGRGASLEEWGAACALLDRYWATRCSAAVLAPHWALTAAHCISPRIAYVKYNAVRPAAPQGDVQPVLYLYRHPEYKVVHEDDGSGMDVTLLHHDVGLVRTRAAMHLHRPPALRPLSTLALYDPMDIRNEEVEVLGFGRTDRSSMGEQLVSARLRLVTCARGTWFHCACGVTEDDTAGVCSGDSGGPVLYRGAQVAVTSMGPLECAQGRMRAGEAPATSVFTTLVRYVALINGTIQALDADLLMERLTTSTASPPSLLPPLLPLAATALLLLAS